MQSPSSIQDSGRKDLDSSSSGLKLFINRFEKVGKEDPSVQGDGQCSLDVRDNVQKTSANLNLGKIDPVRNPWNKRPFIKFDLPKGESILS